MADLTTSERQFGASRTCPWRIACVSAAWGVLLTGCASYQFDFVSQRVINSAVVAEGRPLRVDIVSIGRADLLRDDKLTRCTAAKWFAYRREHDGYPMVPEAQVTSLELQGAGPQTDIIRVKHRHHEPHSPSAVIYIFADFDNPGEDPLLAPHQYRIGPISSEGGVFTVNVSGYRIDLTPGPHHGPRRIRTHHGL